MFRWQFVIAGMSAWAVLTSAQAAEPHGGDGGYAPIFMMYTGEASVARLSGLKQFLDATNAPPAVAQDTVDAVLYKLRNFKAGFAYPIYMSETGRKGNACVVADGQHDEVEDAATILASKTLRNHVLKGAAPVMPVKDVLENVLYHEMFHCFDLMKTSQLDVGMQILHHGSGYVAYMSEVGADAFSALRYLRAGGDKALLRHIRDYRTVNLLNGDAAHYTARTLDHIIWHYDAQALKNYTTTQLVELANRIREETLLSPEDFAAVEAAAHDFHRTLTATIGEAPVPHAVGHVQKLVYTQPLDSGHLSQLIIQVRSALFNLGGDITERNAVFHRVFKRYYVPIKRIQRADASRQ